MKFSTLSTFFSFVVLVPTVFSLPVQRDRLRAFGKRANHSSFQTVIYSDGVLPETSQIAGFNTLLLSFLLTSGPTGTAAAWAALGDSERSDIKSEYNAAGINVMVSAFGDTDLPTTRGVDPIAVANTMSNFVIENELDGIDVDYEDFGAMNAQDGGAEQWLIAFTTQLRANLPSPQYIITHAPVGPWFSAQKYASGAYVKVDQAVGDLIDWYNVQFYNQGTEYTTCDGLLNESSSDWPNTSVFQLNTVLGINTSKLIIGKPAIASDAGSGFMDTTLLATCLGQAVDAGYTGGVMVWEFPQADSVWISQVMSQIGSTPASQV